MSVTPHPMGSCSQSSGPEGRWGNTSAKVYLEDGYLWSHIYIYTNGHTGAASGSATAVFKDGTSKSIVSQNNGTYGGARTYYLTSYLSNAEIAKLDYIAISAYAEGVHKFCKDDYEHGHACVAGNVTVYGLAVPWISI